MPNDEIIITTPKPKAVVMILDGSEIHTFDSGEEAYLFLGEHNDRNPNRGPDPE